MMEGSLRLSGDQTPTFEQNYSFVPSSMAMEEDESYLTALLARRNNQVQNQKSQIINLKSSAKKDLEIIERLDKAVPIEEKKISELSEQYSVLQTKFKNLQFEMNHHTENEEHNRSALHNTEQELNDIYHKQNEMRSIIDQSKKKQKDLNDHIMTLQNSCELLTNDIQNLKLNNTTHSKVKNQIEIMKNELNFQNEKIEQIRQKQKEMAECLIRTNLQIQEYQNKNLKAELELYDELKLKESISAKREKMDFDYNVEPEEIQQDVAKAQERLKQKEILLQNEREIFTSNEEQVNKLNKKLTEQKRFIHRLKKHINILEMQIHQEQYLMLALRQQHEQLQINTNQFSNQIEHSIKKIEKIKNEKKSLKKQLQQAKDSVEKLQNKISSAISYANPNIKERNFYGRSNIHEYESPMQSNQIYDNDNLNYHDNYGGNYQNNYQGSYQNNYQDNYQNNYQDNYQNNYQDNYKNNYQGNYQNNYQDNYQDQTVRTVELMRKQSNNLKKNHKRIEDIKFDQQLLNKRIKNCHTGISNKQLKRDSLFSTSKYAPK